MPRLLNKRCDAVPPGAVYIGRPSPYGNPFVAGRHGDRETVVKLFEEQALPLMNLESLRGRDLVCWCAPLLCHGEAIMRKLYGSDWQNPTDS